MTDYSLPNSSQSDNPTIGETIVIGDEEWQPLYRPGLVYPYRLRNLKTLTELPFATETSRNHTIEMGQRLLGVETRQARLDSARVLAAALANALTFNTPGGK